MKHYRIKTYMGLTGGEWDDSGNAAKWGREHITGFFTVVECDRHGNELRTDSSLTLDSLKERIKRVPWHSGMYLDAFEVDALREALK